MVDRAATELAARIGRIFYADSDGTGFEKPQGAATTIERIRVQLSVSKR